MTSATFAREPLARVRPELADLLAQHWDEVAHDKDARTLDPDWATFEALEAAGQLFVLTVRMDGRLVGYLGAFLRPHLHSRATCTAYVDAVFLTAEARHGNTGLRLLQHANTALGALADYIYWHIKPERDFAPLLRRMGYHFVESIWGRAVQRVGV
jgi:hypothetical protein